MLNIQHLSFYDARAPLHMVIKKGGFPPLFCFLEFSRNPFGFGFKRLIYKIQSLLKFLKILPGHTIPELFRHINLALCVQKNRFFHGNLGLSHFASETQAI